MSFTTFVTMKKILSHTCTQSSFCFPCSATHHKLWNEGTFFLWSTVTFLVSCYANLKENCATKVNSISSDKEKTEEERW